MWTGDLVGRLLPGGEPPGPRVQRLNAALHREPLQTVAYRLYWSAFLLVLPPIAGAVLAGMLLLEVLRLLLRLPPRGGRVDPRDEAGAELAVLVTGCDSGIGRDLALRLAGEGFVVFAGCLREESAAALGPEPRVRPLVMDVTRQDHVDGAYRAVRAWLGGGDGRRRRRLHALVNNAGIMRAGLVDWCELSSYELCMEVNCLAQVRTTKAFLPIFKEQAAGMAAGSGGETPGTIVNVVSIMGCNSSNGMAASPYEVSKNAAESFTDCLRLEMKMFGVRVVSVNPSVHRTPLAGDAVRGVREGVWDPLPAARKEEYGTEFLETYLGYAARCISGGNWDAAVAVDSIVEECILSTDPPAQLIVGMDAKFGMVALRMLPQWCRLLVHQALLPALVPAVMVGGEGEEGVGPMTTKQKRP